MVDKQENRKDNIIVRLAKALCGECSIFCYSVLYIFYAFLAFTFFTAKVSTFKYFSYFLVAYGLLIIISTLVSKKAFNLLKFDNREILLFLFMVSFVLSSIFAIPYGGITDNFKSFVWLSLEIVVLYWINYKALGSKWFKRIIMFFIVMSCIWAVISLVMAFIGFVYSPSEKYGDVNMGGLYFGRLWGLYSDANVGAVVCCVSIFLIAYLAISSKKLKVVLPLIAISIQLLFVSLSGSRSAIVALFVTTFVIVCLILFKFINFNNMKRAVTIIQKIVLSLFVSCVFVGAVLICEIAYEQIEPKILNMIKGPVSDPDALFPSYIADQVRDECGIPDPHEDEEIDDSISHVGILGRNEGGDLSNKRFSLWKSGFELVQTSPIIGVSARNFLTYAKTFLPDSFISKIQYLTFHNSYVDILVAQGLLGFLIFMSFIVICLIDICKLIKGSDNILYVKYCVLFGALITVLVQGCFSAELVYVNTPTAIIFWILLGMIRKESLNKNLIKTRR